MDIHIILLKWLVGILVVLWKFLSSRCGQQRIIMEWLQRVRVILRSQLNLDINHRHSDVLILFYQSLYQNVIFLYLRNRHSYRHQQLQSLLLNHRIEKTFASDQPSEKKNRKDVGWIRIAFRTRWNMQVMAPHHSKSCKRQAWRRTIRLDWISASYEQKGTDFFERRKLPKR